MISGAKWFKIIFPPSVQYTWRACIVRLGCADVGDGAEAWEVSCIKLNIQGCLHLLRTPQFVWKFRLFIECSRHQTRTSLANLSCKHPFPFYFYNYCKEISYRKLSILTPVPPWKGCFIDGYVFAAFVFPVAKTLLPLFTWISPARAISLKRKGGF